MTVAPTTTTCNCTYKHVQTKDATYELIQCLGKGGNGTVFEVRITKDERYALKVPNQSLGEETVQKILTLGSVRNIVRYVGELELTEIHYSGPDCKLHYTASASQPPRIGILMELLPSKDCVEQFVAPFFKQPSSRLTLAKIETIAKQALQTLKDMDQMGYVLCDLKSNNMSFDVKSNQLKVFDFGSASLVSKINPKSPGGTIDYKSPECVLLTRYDGSRDVWSLGVTLFELYAGTRLFKTTLGDPRQRVIDYLHILKVNKGKLPPATIIEASPLKHLFYMYRGKFSLSFDHDESEICEEIAEEHMMAGRGANVGEMAIWKARLHGAAQLRGDPKEVAEAVIALIKPMISYKKRISAAEALRRFESSEEKVS